jgi:hypothetical protein
MKLKDELANVQAVFSENLDRIKEYAPQLKASGRYKVFENRLAWDCLKAFVGNGDITYHDWRAEK